jgi:Transmembrane domain of unknown function (DUF3566)
VSVARPKGVLETENLPPPPSRVERERLKREQRTKLRKPKSKLVPVAVRRPMERRYRQTIRSVDLWTVLKISVCFYLTGLIVSLGACIVLWWIASGLGVIHNVERFIGDLLGSDNFQFLSWRILRGATLVGLVIVCLQVVCTVLAAAFYNLFSELLGGIEITVVEEEPPGS